MQLFILQRLDPTHKELLLIILYRMFLINYRIVRHYSEDKITHAATITKYWKIPIELQVLFAAYIMNMNY